MHKNFYKKIAVNLKKKTENFSSGTRTTRFGAFSSLKISKCQKNGKHTFFNFYMKHFMYYE